MSDHHARLGAHGLRPAQVLRVAPLLLVALVGLLVCFMIACGGAGAGGGDAEDADNGDDPEVCTGVGYASGRFGIQSCTGYDSDGYGSSRRGY